MAQRYYALDSLRGIIMWLGIIIHVALNHMVGENVIPWRDSQTGQLADFIGIFLHTFRMPVFFILAGFFAAMLLDKQGPRGMCINRVKRLALPFAIFWPIILVSTTIIGQLFLSKMHLGYLDSGFDASPYQVGRTPINTLHLWFLYYLIGFCITAALIYKISRQLTLLTREKIVSLFSILATRWWGLIILTLPLVGVGIFYEFGFVVPDGSLIPNFGEYIHNGTFFLFGWFFFLNKEKVMPHIQQYCWHYAISGAIVFFMVLGEFGMIEQGIMDPEHARAIIAFTYNFVSWLWSLALIGIFLRYLPNQNAFLRYLSDSSYWVYLVHILGTTGFGILLYDTPLTLLPKMAANVLLTTLVCLISYHLFVRRTWIGKLLNGRKYFSTSAVAKEASSVFVSPK